MDEKLYYEAVEQSTGWGWKIYHYDASGNKEIIIAKSSGEFISKEAAEDDACLYQEEHGIDAEGM